MILINSKKFRQKYRIGSLRLRGFSYASCRSYFLTICTQNRVLYFGDIVSAAMRYSPLGMIVSASLREIPRKFPFIRLDSWVIMPNHVHGIFTITSPAFLQGDAMNGVSTQDDVMQNNTIQNNPMIHTSLATVIRWFKGRTTFACRKIIPEFSWQSRFYDRILRDDEEFRRTVMYIEKNPENWEIDALFRAFQKSHASLCKKY